jgi:hypothetical protein
MPQELTEIFWKLLVSKLVLVDDEYPAPVRRERRRFLQVLLIFSREPVSDYK